MPDVTAACAVCGQMFVKRKAHAKYCSPQCGREGAPSAARVSVTCSVCNAPMTQRSRYVGMRPAICSMECQTEAKRQRNARSRSELPEDHPARWILGQLSSPLRYYQCADCGSPACYDARFEQASRCTSCRQEKKRQDKRRRLDGDRSRFISGVCTRCGQSFVADRATGASVQAGGPYCSYKCKTRSSSSRRRARKANATIERVDEAYVYMRDSYTCQICHKRLAMSRSVPHPKAPTIDHIIPLVAGGDHSHANVRAAHFICNSLKGGNATDDQLLLVG